LIDLHSSSKKKLLSRKTEKEYSNEVTVPRY
jgi:hypothetical protein